MKKATIKKIISFAITIFVLSLFFILPLITFSENTGSYTLLTPLPLDSGNTTNSVPLGGNSFGDYLNNVFKLGIIVASLLAVIMIVIGGIQYMGRDSVFSKEDAKSKIYNAIWGLVLALGIYLLLYTINPDLVKLNLKIAEIPATPAGTTATTAADNVDSLICNGCVEIPGQYGIPTKTPGACSGTSPCKINSRLAENLRLLARNYDWIGKWRVTEAWPPTGYSSSRPNGIHSSSCHGNATCVDVNFTSGTPATAENINSFCQAIKNSVGAVMYEVQNQAAFSALDGKVPNCVLRNTGSVPHFHFPI